MKNKLIIIFLLFSAPSFAISKDLDFDGMVLSVSDAPTAQIFNIYRGPAVAMGHLHT